MKAGAIGFLSKPFDSQDMIRCLDMAMKASKPRAPGTSGAPT